jgi:glycerophosphoryl diester phosphodiesterase
MRALEWLVARPIAHRGLHDGSTAVENTASAFTAAIAAGYGIECDLQVSADGEAMVFHDATLDRLTQGNAPLDSMAASELKRVDFRTTADHMLTLGELCDITAGRTPLLIEMKSHFPGDCRLLERSTRLLSAYAGPAALMSFDLLLMGAVRALAPALPRGIVAEKAVSEGRPGFAGATMRSASRCIQLFRARPQFIAFAVDELPHPLPAVARNLFGLPMLAWTVRTRAQERAAKRYADQIIFEGFRP